MTDEPISSAIPGGAFRARKNEAIANRLDFRVIDDTDDYIVLDKPAPMLVHPGAENGVRTLWHELRDLLAYELATGGQISIINRLDRETSGVVLVAKTARAARRFGKLMMGRAVRKTYQALVWGWPSETAFVIDAPILRKGEVEPSEVWLRRLIHPAGLPSRTEVEVLERFQQHGQKFSLLRLRPVTGRMHQLRVHLQHAGHSIVGDKLYGPDHRCYLEFIETGWTPALAARLLLPRHALHAQELAVDLDGQTLRWDSPWPAELALDHGPRGPVSKPLAVTTTLVDLRGARA